MFLLLQNEGTRRIDATKQKELEIKMSKKYKRVKLFERVKVERQLKQVMKKIGEEDGDMKKMLEQRAFHQKNLFYIKNFPRDRAYVSLFPAKVI